MIKFTEHQQFILRLIGNMAEWEKDNGHDDMMNKFRGLLSTLVAHTDPIDNPTITESPFDLADAICQDYQDHINKYYVSKQSYDKLAKKYTALTLTGEVTKIKNNMPDWIDPTDALIGLK